jgi:hypothetical protein
VVAEALEGARHAVGGQHAIAGVVQQVARRLQPIAVAQCQQQRLAGGAAHAGRRIPLPNGQPGALLTRVRSHSPGARAAGACLLHRMPCVPRQHTRMRERHLRGAGRSVRVGLPDARDGERRLAHGAPERLGGAAARLRQGLGVPHHRAQLAQLEHEPLHLEERVGAHGRAADDRSVRVTEWLDACIPWTLQRS